MQTQVQAKFLCNVCNSIFVPGSYGWWSKKRAKWPGEGLTHLPARGFFQPHHSSYETFLRAIATSCWICLQIKRHIETNEPGGTEAANFQPLSYRLKRIGSKEGYLDTWYYLSFQDSRGSHPDECFVIQEVQPWTRLHRLADTSKLQRYTGDESLIELAKGWLVNCHEQHFNCHKSGKDEWYPTRLLDVSRDHIRLLLGSQTLLSGPYATLSHCWGIENSGCLRQRQCCNFLKAYPSPRSQRPFSRPSRRFAGWASTTCGSTATVSSRGLMRRLRPTGSMRLLVWVTSIPMG